MLRPAAKIPIAQPPTRHRRAGLAGTLAALVSATGAIMAGVIAPQPALAQQPGGFDFSQPDVVALTCILH